jgi:hypothetical protein
MGERDREFFPPRHAPAEKRRPAAGVDHLEHAEKRPPEHDCRCGARDQNSKTQSTAHQQPRSFTAKVSAKSAEGPGQMNLPARIFHLNPGPLDLNPSTAKAEWLIT